MIPIIVYLYINIYIYKLDSYVKCVSLGVFQYNKI